MTDQETGVADDGNAQHEPPKRRDNAALYSEDMKELLKALVEAQKEVRHAVKESENTHFKNKYADLAAVFDACKEAMNNHGIAILQQSAYDAQGRLMLGTTLYHAESGQWARTFVPIKPTKDDPQGLGSALTYARRYGLSCIAGVAPSEDDDDGNAASQRMSEEDMLLRLKGMVEKADYIIANLTAANFELSRKDARGIFKFLPKTKQDELTAAMDKFAPTKDEAPKTDQAKKQENQPQPEPQWLTDALKLIVDSKDAATLEANIVALNERRKDIPKDQTLKVREVCEEMRAYIATLPTTLEEEEAALPRHEQEEKLKQETQTTTDGETTND